MASSIQILKSPERNQPNSLSIATISELHLNGAFDGLNRCKLKIQSLPSELGNIIAESVAAGVEVYTHALQLHHLGRYQYSKDYAKAVWQLCTLLGLLAEEPTENLLKLPRPPQVHLLNFKKKSAPRNLHSSLVGLDAFIQQRMMRASKLSKGRLCGYAEILFQISKHLTHIEDYH